MFEISALDVRGIAARIDHCHLNDGTPFDVLRLIVDTPEGEMVIKLFVDAELEDRASAICEAANASHAD